MSDEISKTLEDICIYIGIATHWKDEATLHTYLERLINNSGHKSRDEEVTELKDTFDICDTERLRFLKEKADIVILMNKEVQRLEAEIKIQQGAIAEQLKYRKDDQKRIRSSKQRLRG